MTTSQVQSTAQRYTNSALFFFSITRSSNRWSDNDVRWAELSSLLDARCAGHRILSGLTAVSAAAPCGTCRGHCYGQFAWHGCMASLCMSSCKLKPRQPAQQCIVLLSTCNLDVISKVTEYKYKYQLKKLLCYKWKYLVNLLLHYT